MNTGTFIGSLVMAGVLVLLIAVLFRQMKRGWLHRARRQLDSIGRLPALPETVGPPIIPATKGLYVGSTIAVVEPLDSSGPSAGWLERVVVGDLGFRCKAVLTRYPEGIMLQRAGATPIWMPDESISAIRTERGIAGKVITGGDGILAIRWKLPSGTEIDTGFRGDDRRELANWVEEAA